MDEAENIAEYVSMIDNQVQQIQTLGNQLSEFKNYESLFGNPSQVVLSMVAPLDADLQSLEPGLNLENLVGNADGNYALTYNDSGIYATVGVSFQTPGGQTIQRPADQYKPFAAINQHGEQLRHGCRQRGATARDHQGPDRADDRATSERHHRCRSPEVARRSHQPQRRPGQHG